MGASKVKVVNQGPSGYIFFVAWVGALFYFVSQVDGFWNIVLAFLKSFVWPAIVLFRAMEMMNI